MQYRGFSNADAVIEEEEKTLAMIKPDGFRGNYTDGVKRVILESGFVILKEKVVTLDEDTAAKFYAEHSSRSFFTNLIKYMTSGPVLVMVLQKKNAVADWRVLIGPTDARKAKITHPDSIRAMCGVDSEKNCAHGSDSFQSAQREISFFFEGSSPAKFKSSTSCEEDNQFDFAIVGNTKVIAAVYGPREIQNRSQLLSDKALVTLTNIHARSRSTEISLVIRQTMEACIMTHSMPRSQIDIFVQVLQADGGTRSACINAASFALADAGIPMSDLMDSKLPTDIFENVMELAMEGCKAIANYLREILQENTQQLEYRHGL
ncbi:hypothetical protein ACFE04_021787 [Oxalis oulophora]